MQLHMPCVHQANTSYEDEPMLREKMQQRAVQSPVQQQAAAGAAAAQEQGHPTHHQP
jgi:hypothetical protein